MLEHLLQQVDQHGELQEGVIRLNVKFVKNSTAFGFYLVQLQTRRYDHRRQRGKHLGGQNIDREAVSLVGHHLFVDAFGRREV